jgi:hypothetical protein
MSNINKKEFDAITKEIFLENEENIPANVYDNFLELLENQDLQPQAENEIQLHNIMKQLDSASELYSILDSHLQYQYSSYHHDYFDTEFQYY